MPKVAISALPFVVPFVLMGGVILFVLSNLLSEPRPVALGTDLPLRSTTAENDTEMCATVPDIQAFARAQTIRDFAGIVSLEDGARCWTMPAGTMVKLLGRVDVTPPGSSRWTAAEVRVLQGVFANKTGYVPAEAVLR